jgi:signal peptidase I
VDGYAVTVRRLPGRPRTENEGETTAEKPVERSLGRRVLRRLGKVGLNLLFVAMLGCAAIMIGPSLLGYQRYIILTGSMTGTYDRGSIVFDKPVPTASLKVGDPISYAPPPGFTSQGLETHRIYRITTGKDGVRTYQTKGDANKAPDVWHFQLPRPTQDEVKFHVPEVGYLFLILSIREFRLVIVAVPAILLGLYELRKLWREGGAEVQRQKLAALGWRPLADSGSGAVLAPIDTPAAIRRFAVLDLRLPARAQTPSIPEAPPKRRVRLRAGTTLRINRVGTERFRGSGGDRRQSSEHADRISLGVDARPLRIRRLSREIRALERLQVSEDMERAAADSRELRSWTPA